VAKGPLVVGWGNWSLDPPRAGTVGRASAEVVNAGSIRWGSTIRLSYHWLDERGNPIAWDGIRTPLPPLEPGETARIDARVRAPIPPGRYRFALDVVAEHRAWFSELGNEMATADVDVRPRDGEPSADLPTWVEPSGDWRERVAAAHSEGYAVVAGSIDWPRRRPRALDPYRPRTGRVPSFPHPLLCPSVLDGVVLERLPDVAGLPAFAAPADEPWIYDGRAVLRARPRSDRRRG
jgi:hypothetical protein